MIADVANAFFATQCVIQMHGTATRDQENMSNSPVCESTENVVGNAQRFVLSKGNLLFVVMRNLFSRKILRP